MKHKLLIAALAAAAPICAATSTVTTGSTLPKTCSVGALYFLTGAPIGQNLYGCVSKNSWALEGVGTGVVVKPPSTGGGTPTGGDNGAAVSVSWANPPSGLSVPAKQSIKVAFDRAATWTLQSGSRGSISVNGQTVTYSAPAVRAQNSVAGCQVLPSDTVYTTPIDKLPVHSQSAAWIAQSIGVSPAGIGFGESWGHNIVDNSLVPTPMTFYYSTSLNGAQYQVLSGSNRNRETGALTTDGNNDHHMITVNHQSCHFYETYHDYVSGREPSPYTANSGYDYLSSSYDQPKDATTDAAGLPIFPLTVHLSEFEAGSINHALRFTSCAGCIASPAVWPAIGSTAATPGASPMGSRWRLKASFDTTHFSLRAQVVLNALKKYGMILADIGGMQQIQVDDDTNQDIALTAALGEISSTRITQDQFEIVDESSFITAPNSSRVNPSNGYNAPPNYAVLNGVDSAGNKLTIPISIQPVLIGVPNETLQVQAGTSYQIPTWVNNASNQSVTWAVTSGPGVISPSGVYTPPASVSAPTPFVVTATAVVDPTATASIRGNIIPSGAIRIDAGNTATYLDSKGNLWLADTLGVWSGSYNNDNESYQYPGPKWGNIADWQIYSTFKYTWGDDISYGPFVVPNGTYNVTFMFAEPNCTGIYDEKRSFDNGLVTGGSLGLDVNGSLTMFSVGGATKDTCLVPAIQTVPVTVKHNLLTATVRATGGEGAHQAPFLNGLAIIPASQSKATGRKLSNR